MAVKSVTLSELAIAGQGEAWLAQWTLANGDSGEPISLHGFTDRSVQIEGTFGSGGSVSLEGSNDGTNYEILRDPGLTALTFTAKGLKQVLEVAQKIAPFCTAGDGTTALIVSMIFTRPRR